MSEVFKVSDDNYSPSSTTSTMPRPNLLTLPLEIRLQVYSYLLAPVLFLDLCEDLPALRLAACNPKLKHRSSPILSYLTTRWTITQWARRHGLHLLSTNKTVRTEVLEVLNRMQTTLEVHCRRCLKQLLAHLVVDLGIAQPLFHQIGLLVDYGDNVVSHLQHNDNPCGL